jgi:hypothetical protein
MNSGDENSNGEIASIDEEVSEAPDKVDDAVGFKRPPKLHQFRKGKSGNPKGRPKKVRSRIRIVGRVLMEKRKVDLTGKGRPVQLTTIEIVVYRLRQVALEGSPRAFKTYRDLESRFGLQEQSKPGGVLVIPEVDSLETWMKLFGPKD